MFTFTHALSDLVILASADGDSTDIHGGLEELRSVSGVTAAA